jgi:hypothetical protein
VTDPEPMSGEQAARIIGEITALRATFDEGRFSMRITIVELDVLLAAAAERDDLKRRLLTDWEPDL